MHELTEKQLWVLDQLYDDHYGLWELGVPSAFPEFRPDTPNSQLNVLCALIEAGYVGLYDGNLIEMTGERVPSDGVRAALLQPESWDPVDKRRGFYVTLEPKGLHYYQGRGYGHPSA